MSDRDPLSDYNPKIRALLVESGGTRESGMHSRRINEFANGASHTVRRNEHLFEKNSLRLL